MARAGNSSAHRFRMGLILLFLCPVTQSARAQSTQPALTVELRAVSTTNGTVVDSTHVEITGGAGTIVQLDVFGVISGVTDPENLNFIDFLHGSFLSSFGELPGDLKAGLTSDYNDFISGRGFEVDLDGDGDLDVGSNNDTSLTGYFRAYHRKDAPLIPEIRVGTLTWTCTGVGQSTLLNFRPRNASDAAGWATDGEAYDPSNGIFRSGDAVTITWVPEPTCQVVSTCLSITSFGRRRLRARLTPAPRARRRPYPTS